MVKTITKLQAFRMMEQTKGKFFTISFVKRTNGEKRAMNCRLGVTKGVKGVGNRFDIIAKDILKVYDVQSKGFRSVSLDSMYELKCNKQKFNIV